MSVAIEAAEDGEVAGDGGNVFGDGVVDTDGDEVIPGEKEWRNVEAESGETAPMSAGELAIDEDFSGE